MIVIVKTTGGYAATSVVKDEGDTLLLSMPGSGIHHARVTKSSLSYVMFGDLFSHGFDNVYIALSGWGHVDNEEGDELARDLLYRSFGEGLTYGR